MAIDDDIAQAKKMSELNSKISDLHIQIDNALTNFDKKIKLLTEKKDEEIKGLFKKKLSHPDIIVDSKDDKITGKHDAGLIYTLIINDKERIIKKKLASTETAYKYKYTFSADRPEQHYWSARGSEEDIKNTEFSSLKNYLDECNKAVEELESGGIQIEYTEMKNETVIFASKDHKNEEQYSKTDIKRLFRLIGLED